MEPNGAQRSFKVSSLLPILSLFVALLLQQQDPPLPPLYLRTRSDRFLYRSAVAMSIAGLCLTTLALLGLTHDYFIGGHAEPPTTDEKATLAT